MSPLNTVALGLASALLLLLAGVLLIALRRPILARIGVRNIPRRPLQSLLIMVGLTMSTTIFIASMSLGDTLNHSLRRHIIEAYGQIDQVVSPPQLQALLNFLGNGSEPTSGEGSDSELEDFLVGLATGDLNTLIQLFDEGLPGIPQDRFLQLEDSLSTNPLVDGAEGVIFFPTVVRDMSSGQGSPLGMIFAVNDSYTTEFGLHDLDGNSVLPSHLRTGVGDVFLSFSKAVGSLQQNIGEVAEAAGWEAGSGLETTLGIAALASVLFQPESTVFNLSDLNLDLAVLRNLGIDTTFLEEAGVDSLSLEGLGVDLEALKELGIDPSTPIEVPSLNTLGADFLTSANLFAEFNLNTMAHDLDSSLQPFGMQMRQGQVYLSELGALQLEAQVGDLLEIFIGPIPVRYQVKAIVKEAGPFAPLAPVVMFEVAEAQKLLFMSERINAILISNVGDEFTGIQHTDEVNSDLQLLAYDQGVLSNIESILTARPNAEILIRQSTSAIELGTGEFRNQSPAELFFIQLLGGLDNATQLQNVANYVGDAQASDELAKQFRLALSNPEVRRWLSDLPISPQDQRELQVSFQNLDQFEVLPQLSKRFAVEGVEIAGVAFGALFWVPGSLSILAGVILIFLIFVLLAAERRHELGIVRAVGMQRGHVVQTFVTEGVIYDLAAALLGLGLGLLVAYGMIGVMSGLFAGFGLRLNTFDNFFNLQWSVAPASLVISYCLGVLVAGTVVVFSSWRVSRMNIVSAIRNLPEDIRSRNESRWWRFGKFLLILILLAVGGLRFWADLPGRELIPVQLFESLLLAGAAGLAHILWEHFLPLDDRRGHYVPGGAGLGLLGIWIWPWVGTQAETSFPDDPERLMLSFIVAAPFLLVGAILAVMGLAHLLGQAFVWAGSGLGAIAPAVRLAVAYPLEHKFRTGIAILLFSMVITTVVIMTQFIQAIEVFAIPQDEDTAGFDMVIAPGLLSVFDPLVDLESESVIRDDFPIGEVDVMASVSELDVKAHQLEPSFNSSFYPSVKGVDDGYIKMASEVYGFSRRGPGYATDAEVWNALASGQNVALATRYPFDTPEWPAAETGRRPRPLGESERSADNPLPFVSVELTVDSEGRTMQKTVQVIGILESPSTLAGGSFQIHRRLLDELNGSPVIPSNHYVKAAQGADPKTVAIALEKSLLTSAQDVNLFSEELAVTQTISKSVLRLFRAFFTLGLVVGMTGLAVISIRAVLERRQQIGMLRAIGYKAWNVAAIFLLEASFISLSGILVGGATGLFLGQQIIARFFESNLEQSIPVPWLSVSTILISTFGLALLSSLLPAWQASRVFPAEALRYE